MISLELDGRLAATVTAAQTSAGKVIGASNGWGPMHVIKVGDPMQLPVISIDGHHPYFLADTLSDTTTNGEQSARIYSAFALQTRAGKYLRTGLELYHSLHTNGRRARWQEPPH